MPELPEVETIRRILRNGGLQSPSLLYLRILGAEILWERTVEEPAPPIFIKNIEDQQIIDIKRRGKFLIFVLENYYLLIHLRMSGDLIIEPAVIPPGKHHRLLLHLEGENRLSFVDVRKFGRVWLVKDDRSVVGHLGPEPLSAEFTADELFQDLKKHQRQIKTLLLDQKFLAGLGNIYADEALFCAKIHPLMKSNQLDRDQCDHLWGCIRKVLLDGINKNGASIDWVYRGGDFQNYFKVYQRSGEPCSLCGSTIERIVVGQRGTHLCPRCQQI